MPVPTGPEGDVVESTPTPTPGTEALLSHDNIPDTNQSTKCFSCGENLVGLFCHACGQKNDNFRRSIFALVTETFASIFSLENRMWRTWSMLFFKPGRVARDFADGKRTVWTSPVRMYLALSIILFGYIGLTETRIFSIRTDIVPIADTTQNLSELEDSSIEFELDFGFFRRQSVIDKLNDGSDFERISKYILGNPQRIFVFNGDLSQLNLTPTVEQLSANGSWPNEETDQKTNQTQEESYEIALKNYREKIEIAVQSYNQILSTKVDEQSLATKLLNARNQSKSFELLPFLEGSENQSLRELASNSVIPLDNDLARLGLSREILDTLPTEIQNDFGLELGTGQINGVTLSETDVQNLAKEILRNPALLNDGLSKYLPRIMFLMMPFAALIGLIFIRGKQTALLYDHLVHATYIHAMTFACLFLLILTAQWLRLGGTIYIFLAALALYLPLSAKVMFQRSWVKTLFASYSIAFIYGFVMFFIVILLAAGSIAEAVKDGQLISIT